MSLFLRRHKDDVYSVEGFTKNYLGRPIMWFVFSGDFLDNVGRNDIWEYIKDNPDRIIEVELINIGKLDFKDLGVDKDTSKY